MVKNGLFVLIFQNPLLCIYFSLADTTYDIRVHFSQQQSSHFLLISAFRHTEILLDQFFTQGKLIFP